MPDNFHLDTFVNLFEKEINLYMKMRNLLVTGAFAMMAFVGFSQNVQPSVKVVQGLGKNAAKALNESQIEYQNYFGQFGYVVDVATKNTEGLPLLSSVLKPGKTAMDAATVTQDNFNPFLYNITPLPNEQQFFLVDGTNKTVQIHSQATIDQYYGYYQTNQAKLKKLNK